jgi:hypothetical protein
MFKPAVNQFRAAEQIIASKRGNNINVDFFYRTDNYKKPLSQSKFAEGAFVKFGRNWKGVPPVKSGP